MDSRQKKFVALLVIIGLAYAALLWAGGRDAGDPSAEPPPWVEWLEGMLVEETPLAIEDMAGPCKKGDAFRVPHGRSCRIEVPPTQAAVRNGGLRLEEGRKAVLVLEQPATGTERHTLTPDLAVDLKVFDKGATITIDCEDGSRRGCVLRLQASG